MSGGVYVTPGVAARWLGVTHRTVVRWLKRGTLQGTRECATCAEDSEDGCTACRWFVFREALERRLAAARRPE